MAVLAASMPYRLCARDARSGTAELQGLRRRIHRAGRVRPGSHSIARPVRRRAGRPHPRRPQRRGAPHRFPRSARGRAGRRRARAARARVRAATARAFRQLHQPVRRHRRRALPRERPIRSSPMPASRFDLRWGGAAAHASSRSRSRITTAATSCSVRMATSTSALAMAARANDPEHRAQNPNELLGKMLRIDVNVPDAHPTGYQVPPDNPFVVRPPGRARPEIWAFGLRNPWRYNFDDPGARRNRRAASSATSARTRGRRSTTSRAARGGRNYGWRNREGAHDNVDVAAAGLSCRSSIRFTNTPARVGQSVTGGFVYRGRALGAAYRGPLLLRGLRRRAACGRSRWRSIGHGGGAASDLHRAHRRARRSHAARNVSSFGVDADGELYIVSLTRGSVIAVVGPLSTPPVPTDLRVIR